MTVDVVAMGEILVELRADESLRTASTFHRSFSGDALNTAAAAVAAGARTALFTVVGDDELGDAILDRLESLGIDTRWVSRADRPNGLYMLRPDTDGRREFLYWRSNSAASGLSPADIDAAGELFEQAGGMIVSGITVALSEDARAAVLHAMRIVRDTGGHVTYDPNFRRKLTSEKAARGALAAAAPLASLVTPSCPADSQALLDSSEPATVAETILGLGADAVAITRGSEDAVLATAADRISIPVPANPNPVDATGAGDILAGTATARIVLGDDLATAVRLGVAAASLSVSGPGGTGCLPTLTQTRAHADLAH